MYVRNDEILGAGKDKHKNSETYIVSREKWRDKKKRKKEGVGRKEEKKVQIQFETENSC